MAFLVLHTWQYHWNMHGIFIDTYMASLLVYAWHFHWYMHGKIIFLYTRQDHLVLAWQDHWQLHGKIVGSFYLLTYDKYTHTKNMAVLSIHLCNGSFTDAYMVRSLVYASHSAQNK